MNNEDIDKLIAERQIKRLSGDTGAVTRIEGILEDNDVSWEDGVEGTVWRRSPAVGYRRSPTVKDKRSNSVFNEGS